MDTKQDGDLSQQPVLPLLTELHRSGATGSLRLEQASVQKAVLFRDGQILFAASNDPKDQLASILVEEGKLSPDQMQVAQARVSAGNPLAKILTELGYISQRELAEAARLKVEKILSDLYEWKDGTYHFAAGSLPKGTIDLELSTTRLFFNSIRRIQDREWVLKELGSLETVLSPSLNLETFLSETKPDDEALEVMRLVDGVKTIKQIGSASSLGEFEVCKVLAAALRMGAIEKAEARPAEQGTQEDQAVRPAEAPPSPDTASRLPEEAPVVEAETVALPPPTGTAAPVEEPPGAPTPLPFEEPMVSAPAPSQEAADLLIDEPETALSDELGRMTPAPRRRGMGRAARGTGAKKKVWVALLGLFLMGAVGIAGYLYLWPRVAFDEQAAPTTPAGGAPVTPSPAQPLASASPSSSAPSTARTGAPSHLPQAPLTTPTVAKGTIEEPPAAASSTEPTGGSPAQGDTTAQPRTTPPRPSTPPPAGTDSLARGHGLLENGRYLEASKAFLQHLREQGADKFTVAVGVYCDRGNVARAVQSSGESKRLYILTIRLQGRPCYRVYWGLFDSRQEAQRGAASIPVTLRAADSAPVPVSRLIQ